MSAPQAEAPDVLREAVAHLNAGGVVAFPTDTVPGLACLAESVPGVKAIYALKGRDAEKPLILFVEDFAAVERLTGGLSARQRGLLARLWPGPFTAVLPLAGSWPAGVGRDGAAGFRIPDHSGAGALVRAAGRPLATTSANRSGMPPLARAEDAAALWGAEVFIVPGVATPAPPSTVADLTCWPPRILRPGSCSAERLLELVRAAEAGA